MHWAGVDNRVRFEKSRIAFQRHAALETTARHVALHAFAHWAEVFLSRLTRLRRRKINRVTGLMVSATGVCGRITVSVSFHRDDCTLLAIGCREPPTVLAIITAGQRCDLMGCRRLAGLGKLLQSIKLLAEHAFYKRRHLLKSALNESPNAVRKLEPGVVGPTC